MTGRTSDAPVVSVELTFDDATEQRIRDGWSRLGDAGLSSLGAHPSPSNRPHLSIAVRSRIGDLAALSSIAAQALPFPLTLSALLVFPHGDRVVLARGVVPTAALLALHREVAGAVDDWGDALPHTGAGEWTAHVTLARRLRAADLPRALELLDAAEHHARATGMRVWDAAERRVREL